MAEIVFVGEDMPGSRAGQRLAALRALGHEVTFIRSHPARETYETRPSLARRVRHRLRRPSDRAGVNRALAAAANGRRPPRFVWIDNVQTVRPATLRGLRRRSPETRLVWYAEDDMMRPRNRSVALERSIPLFDLWVTTKSFNARPEELPALGARRVLFVHNSFDPDLHRPHAVDDADRRRLGADVGFVGTFEAARAHSLVRLADAGLSVRVWGNGWSALARRHPNLAIENRPVYGDDLAIAYAATAINLGFLRKANRDLQTCRTIEIPACGGFLLHERNDEVRSILAEDSEAGFFGDDGEMIAACRRWLADAPGRAAVAAAGCRRVRDGGFTHRDRVAEILAAAAEG